MIDAHLLNTLAAKAAKDSISKGYNPDLGLYFWLTICAAEVGEAIDAYRCGRMTNMPDFSRAEEAIKTICKSKAAYTTLLATIYRDKVKDSVDDELADVAIYILSIAGHNNVDFLLASRFNKSYYESALKDKGFVHNCGDLMSAIIDARHKDKDDDLSTSFIGIIDYVEELMSKTTGGSLLFWIKRKMEYNKTRPYLHGRKNDTQNPGCI